MRAILLLLLAASIARAADRPPNIVLIFADDVGREVLGCYGGSSYKTPNIDALAESGTRFTHCYSMPVCHPSRVTILTGRYPTTLGNPKWGDFPKTDQNLTFAALLRQAGYATAVAGKWQLALLKNNPDHPQELGFDESSVFGWHEGPRFHEPMIYENGTLREDTAGTYGPDLYVDFLGDFMEKNRERPFLVWYSMALCHDVTDDIGKPVPFYKDNKWMDYGEMAESMDVMVGRIVKAIDDLDLREETLILFTTDNGTAASSYLGVDENGKMYKHKVMSEFGDRMVQGGKGQLTDLGTRVPLIASWPGKIETGHAWGDLIDFSDFLPTLVEIAGAELPKDVALNGKSFAPRLLGTGAGTRPWVFSEHRGKAWTRNHRFKLYDDGRFFHMEDDPDEKSALAIGDLNESARQAHAMLSKARKGIRKP
ncbi:MAG: arylsulfatase A [Verrucomicrobiales bacterium]|jgi:arylsulfatase A